MSSGKGKRSMALCDYVSIENKWCQEKQGGFPPCVGWNHHSVWLIMVLISMTPQPNCSFNTWDKRKEYISTKRSSILYPQLLTWCWTWAAPIRQKSTGLLAGTEIWLCTAGKTLHPAAPCKLLYWSMNGSCHEQNDPDFLFKINIGPE